MQVSLVRWRDLQLMETLWHDEMVLYISSGGVQMFLLDLIIVRYLLSEEIKFHQTIQIM